MPFVSHTPYPGAQFGAGDFTDDQGRTMPAYLPEEAQRLAANDVVQPDAPPPTATDASYGGREPSLNKTERSVFDEVAAQIGPGVTGAGLRDTFNRESGLDPKIRNPKTGAGGVFQIMPDQEKALLAGTGYDDITKMSKDEQVRLYPKYLAMHNAKPQSDADLALAQGAPAAIGASPEQVIYQPGSKEALANPSWVDKQTGAVTAGSLQAAFGHNVPSDPVSRAAQQLYAPMSGTPAQNQTTVSNRTQKGTPFTDADKAALHAQSTAQAEALTAAYKPVIDAQADMQKYQIQRNEEIKADRDKAQAKEDLARKFYDESTQRVQAATNEVLQDKQPPPFTQSNIFAGILAAVAQGMGTYSAAINHTDNFAMRIINEQIAQDNKRWEQQHLDKVFKVKEAKELNSNQWHDYTTQKTEREMQQRMVVDNELQQQMGLAKSADAQRALGLMQAENMKHYGDLEMTLQRASRGKAETAVSTTNIGEQAGGAPTLETVNARQKAMREAGEDPEVIAAARGQAGESGKIPVKDEDLHKYAQGTQSSGGRLAIDAWDRRLKTLPTTLGLTYNEKTDSFEVDPKAPDPVPRNPLTGTALSAGMLGEYARPLQHAADRFSPWRKSSSEEGMANAESQLRSAAIDYTKVMSGAQATDKERNLHFNQFAGRSREDMAKQLTLAMRETRKKRQELDSAFPGAGESFDRRYQLKAGADAATADEGDIPETPVAP